MGYASRLSKSFEGALRLPLADRSRYVLFSDCHRGSPVWSLKTVYAFLHTLF